MSALFFMSDRIWFTIHEASLSAVSLLATATNHISNISAEFLDYLQGCALFDFVYFLVNNSSDTKHLFYKKIVIN